MFAPFGGLQFSGPGPDGSIKGNKLKMDRNDISNSKYSSRCSCISRNGILITLNGSSTEPSQGSTPDGAGRPVSKACRGFSGRGVVSGSVAAKRRAARVALLDSSAAANRFVSKRVRFQKPEVIR